MVRPVGRPLVSVEEFLKCPVSLGDEEFEFLSAVNCLTSCFGLLMKDSHSCFTFASGFLLCVLFDFPLYYSVFQSTKLIFLLYSIQLNRLMLVSNVKVLCTKIDRFFVPKLIGSHQIYPVAQIHMQIKFLMKSEFLQQLIYFFPKDGLIFFHFL